MSVFAPTLVILWRTIESYGIDPAPLFAAEDINVKLPIDPGLRIPFVKVDSIRKKTLELTGDEALGLRSATVYSPSQLGALGYAWQASLTLRKACSRLQRFIRVVNDKAVANVEDRDGCMVVTLKLDVPSESETVRDDSALATLTMMCRLVSGDQFRLQAVNFRHSEPRDIKPYFEYFGCKLNFDQDENQLFIPLSLADEVLAGANPELAMLNDQVVTRRLALLDRSDIVARVQSQLLDQLAFKDQSADELLIESLDSIAEYKIKFQQQSAKTTAALLNVISQLDFLVAG